MVVKNNFYIITGGPGVGKTTLLNELQHKQYSCVPEVARVIIKDQVKSNGSALPWVNAKEYSRQMLSYSVRDFIELSHREEIYFFDRGIPDTYGYESLMNFDYDENLIHAVNKYRYNKTVFLLPPWREIYQTDQERKQDFEVAKKTDQVLRKSYESLGYYLIEVPSISVSHRARFILDTITKP